MAVNPTLSAQIELASVPCANIKGSGPIATNCEEMATKTCGGCFLVKYCSPGCQKAHWALHRLDCVRGLRNPDWQPGWVREGRQPDFITSNAALRDNVFSGLKSLWGAIPGFDVLNLKENEGANFDEDVALCFAGAEDLRNVVLSVLGMPADHKKVCSYAINCKDLALAARNVLILFISTLSPPEEAAKLMLHVWYSARLTSQMIQLLERHIRRYIAEGVESCQAIPETMSADQTQSMEWNFDGHVLKISLYKWQWEHVLKILDSRPSLDEAERRRRQVMLVEAQLDTRDRQYYALHPSKRASVHKIRETGVLLPFGNGVNGYDHHIFGYHHPNPTMYDPDTGAWLQQPLFEATYGWDMAQTITSGARHGVPKEDINGHTYYHVLDTLTAFCKKLRSLNVRFYMYSATPESLPELLEKTTTISSFDRIDASTLADIGTPAAQNKDGTFVLEVLLLFLGRLLKTPAQNPNAVLITLFTNATEHGLRALGQGYEKARQMHSMKQVQKFMDWKDTRGISDPYFLKFMDACNIFRDYDMLFEQYMEMIGLVQVGNRQGMKMKEPNGVIEKWPYRMKKRAGEEGAQEEFETVLASFTQGGGRYVEWVRKS